MAALQVAPLPAGFDLVYSFQSSGLASCTSRITASLGPSKPCVGRCLSYAGKSTPFSRPVTSRKRTKKVVVAAAPEGEVATEDGSTGPANGSISTATFNGSSASSAPKPKIIRRKKSPPAGDAVADNLQMRAVEEGGVSVEGVARIDREGKSEMSPILRVVGLAVGDLAALLLFAWIGRASHVSAAVDLELLKTADPFIAGWVVAAYFLGDYLPQTEAPKGAKAAATSAAKTWAVGVPLGIVIRSLSKGQVPQLPFVGVSLASTLVLLVGWRTALAAITSNDKDGKDTQAGDRKGNPLEFLELLTSLVRRW